MNNTRLFQAIVVLGAALTGGCGGRETGGITGSYYEPDAGPSDGAIATDGGLATDGGEHESDDGGWHTTK